MFGAPSDINQRNVVVAHGLHWFICHTLAQTPEERVEGVAYALAVRCSPNGQVVLPSEGAQLIRFEPLLYKERREQREKCAEAGHVIERKPGLFGKTYDRCDCGKYETEVKP